MVRVRQPLVRVELVIGQCSWCGGVRLRGRYVRFVGAPIVAWMVSWRIACFVSVRLGFSHGICPACLDWRMSHENRIATLERAVVDIMSMRHGAGSGRPLDREKGVPGWSAQ